MLYSSNGGGMSGQKNDAAGSVGFFRQSLYGLFFFALVVDIEMGEDALHLEVRIEQNEVLQFFPQVGGNFIITWE